MPSGVAGKHEVPLVRSGRCSIQMTFNEPIPTGVLKFVSGFLLNFVD